MFTFTFVLVLLLLKYESSPYYYLFGYGLILYLLVVGYLKKRLDKKISDILLEKCDPISYMEFYKLANSKQKNDNSYILIETISSYYLGEFDYSATLAQSLIEQSSDNSQKLSVFYLLGMCYVFLNEKELAQSCVLEISGILETNKLKKKIRISGQNQLNKLTIVSNVFLDKLDKYDSIKKLNEKNKLSRIEKNYLLGINEWNKNDFLAAEHYFSKLVSENSNLFYVRDSKSRVT